MSAGHKDTFEERDELASAEMPVPGAVVVFSAVPLARPLRCQQGHLTLGRVLPDGSELADEWLSREHAVVEPGEGGWRVRDLGSRNGTFVDGERVERRVVATGSPLVRLGRSVFLPVGDVTPFEAAPPPERDEGVIAGATFGRALEAVAQVARRDDTLVIAGESGTGKELAARVFHRDGPRKDGPFLPVNCSAIPEGIADRLLFGAQKGAYSGATDGVGYLQGADGGTLFLDELTELDPTVQAKLLRAIETGEVMPLGAARPRRVTVRICAATNRDLRQEVAEGRFREDLYYRLAKREVQLPPLRERREDIPWLIAAELRRLDAGLSPHGRLVEECCLRPWPGNVRELLASIRCAGEQALAARRPIVLAEHLPAQAGRALAGPALPEAKGRPEIEAALRRHDGNVTAAARELGMHRTQLYRTLRRLGMTRER